MPWPLRGMPATSSRSVRRERSLIFPLPGNDEMAALLASALGCECGTIAVRRFPDGETYLRYDTLPAGRSIGVLCTLDRPDEKLMSLVLAASTARELGAARVGLIAPYLAYMRQDTRFNEGESVSAIAFARLISAHFDWIVTVDPHLHRIHRLSDIFSSPAASVSAAPLFADWICREVPNPVVIGPDSESGQWVSALAQKANVPFLTLNKVRRGDRQVQIEDVDLSKWRKHTPLLVDDIISTGTTLVASIKLLKANGLGAPVCMAVHGLFAAQAYEALLDAGAKRIVTTNTVRHLTNQIDMSDAIAQTVQSFL